MDAAVVEGRLLAATFRGRVTRGKQDVNRYSFARSCPPRIMALDNTHYWIIAQKKSIATVDLPAQGFFASKKKSDGAYFFSVVNV